MNKQLNEVVVEVTRDPMMKPSTTIYAHEVKLLESIHGEDSVNVVESYQVYAPDDFSPEDEYERLRLKYTRRLKPGQPDPLKEVFPRGVFDLAEALDMRLSGSVNRKYQTESVQKTRNARRVVPADTDTSAPKRVEVKHTEDGQVVDKTVSPRVTSVQPDEPKKAPKKAGTKAKAAKAK